MDVSFPLDHICLGVTLEAVLGAEQAGEWHIASDAEIADVSEVMTDRGRVGEEPCLFSLQSQKSFRGQDIASRLYQYLLP